MIKRWQVVLILCVAVTFLVSLVGVGCAPVTPPSEEVAPPPTFEPVTLKLASYVAAGEHPISKTVNRYAALISERTGGRITIELYEGESLCKAKESFELVSSGEIDMSMVWVAYGAGLLPFAADCCMLPFAWEYPDDHLEALHEQGLYELLAEEYRAFNLEPLWNITSYGQEWFFSKPVKTLEDMRGLKCRSTGGSMDRIIPMLGMVPVALVTPEIYMAAQRGLIDAISHSWGSYFAYKEYEVAPYAVVADTWSQTSFSIMNLDLWNSLPSDLQQIITAVNREIEWWCLDLDKDTSWETIKEFQDKGLLDLYVLPDDEKARWVATVAPFWDDFMKNWGDKGKEVVKIVNYFYERYGYSPIPIPSS